MKLEIGNFYLNAGGEIVQIEDTADGIFTDASDNSYLMCGKCTGDWREFDLIAEIPKELHQYLIQTIKDYHTDLDFKDTIDSVHKIK